MILNRSGCPYESPLIESGSSSILPLIHTVTDTQIEREKRDRKQDRDPQKKEKE